MPQQEQGVPFDHFTECEGPMSDPHRGRVRRPDDDFKPEFATGINDHAIHMARHREASQQQG